MGYVVIYAIEDSKLGGVGMGGGGWGGHGPPTLIKGALAPPTLAQLINNIMICKVIVHGKL